MSAWDLTCRPLATDTINAANEQHPTGTAQQVSAQCLNDRLTKLRLQQQQVIPFALTAAAPLVWATSNPSAATTSEQLQALLTTATSANTIRTPTRASYLSCNASNPVGISQPVAWLEALREQQDRLARRCSAMVAAAAAAAAVTMPVLNQQNCPSSTLMHNSQCNSVSSSPGGSHQSSSPAESVDLTLTRGLISPHQTLASKPHRSSSMSLSSSLSSSSSLSTSSANSFDGDYTLTMGEDDGPSQLLNSTDGDGGEPESGCRVDRRARKKDQNRRAAYNYRRKKMEERDRLIEEEARLVHKHVRLVGKIARLEEKILTILNARSRKVSDANGFLVYHLCPVCMKSCVNITTLRNHIKTQHQPVPNNNLETSEMSSWATPLGHTMSAKNDMDDNDDDDDEDSHPHNGTRDMPNRDRSTRCTMPEGDMLDRDDDHENDSSTF